MTASLNIILVVLPIILLSAGCVDQGSKTDPSNHNGGSLDLTVQPDSGTIGTIITIHSQPEQFVKNRYSVGFTGLNDWLSSDSASHSTIFSYVPFGAQSGPVSVFFDELIGTTNDFRITQSVDTNKLTVANFDISPAITAKDSSVIDRMGFRRTWQAQLRGDTVHISRDFSTGETFYEYNFLLVNRGQQSLPSLHTFWIRSQPDHPGGRIDTIRAGILKLQNFDTSGIISGRFFCNPSTYYILNGTFAFWVDLGR